VSTSDPRRALQEVARLCYDRGLVTGTSGNLSARLHPDPQRPEILVTASGTCLGRITGSELLEVMVNPNLDVVPGHNRRWGNYVPTSELPLHLALYEAFPGIRCIVHTHSPAATAYACIGRELPLLTGEAEVRLRRVMLVSFNPAGCKKLARGAVAALTVLDREGDFNPDGGALLLERHGVVCWAGSALEAFYLAELVEQSARIAIYHWQLRR